MNRTRCVLPLIAAVAVGTNLPTLAADPWADQIVSYSPGSNPPIGFSNSSAALGEPTHFSIAFGGFPTSPFSGAADGTELVSLGEGGVLIVGFDEPVTDDPANPFGIDLLVFGNSFFHLNSFNNDQFDTATGDIASEGGIVSVSADGMDYLVVSGVEADGRFPTLGFRDISIPFPSTGVVSTDFTRPVNPNLDVTGLNTAAVAASYDGSGGGAGIDLATVGLSEIRFVKITNPTGSGVTPEIDGFSDVRGIPEPTTLVLASLILVAAWLRNHRTRTHHRSRRPADIRPAAWFNG